MSQHHPSRVYPGALRRARHVGQRRSAADHAGRARVVASLIAASHALPSDPDSAALLLDGALSHMLDLCSHAARLHLHDRCQALHALDQCAPEIAGRVRLALQAHEPAARLAHCWALLDLLTGMTRRASRSTRPWPHSHDARPDLRSDEDVTESRKDGESHVR